MAVKKDISNKKEVRDLISIALQEDIGHGDVTSANTIRNNKQVKAELIVKSDGVISGINIIPTIINIAKQRKYVLKNITAEFNIKDGEHVKQNTVIGSLHGGIKDVLALERTILNFLSRMSGVATETSRISKLLKKSRAYVYDTRKTLPGWRAPDKYAVLCGGGRNHRYDLGEYLLIKDNHWSADCEGVLDYLKSAKKKKPVEVEIDSMGMLMEPAVLNADIIMLDNFKFNDIKKAIKYLRNEEKKLNKKIEIEVSGGVNIGHVKNLAKLDIDRISIGRITHSAPALDISLEIQRSRKLSAGTVTEKGPFPLR
ncbi:MAG: carboxylating nicotinate-nucleotide diphosphorylase [Elusimicrobiota bacterium]